MREFNNIRIFARTDAGTCCSRTSSSSDAFWLATRNCEFSMEPQPGLSGVSLRVPEWMAKHHRQLVGDAEFEQAKQSIQDRMTNMAEQRELSGVLSRNKKRENDRQPEYRGSATINGVTYWISGWVKQGAEGDKFFSLNFRRKDDQPSAQVQASSQAPSGIRRHSDVGIDKELDDQIPF